MLHTAKAQISSKNGVDGVVGRLIHVLSWMLVRRIPQWHSKSIMVILTITYWEYYCQSILLWQSQPLNFHICGMVTLYRTEDQSQWVFASIARAIGSNHTLTILIKSTGQHQIVKDTRMTDSICSKLIRNSCIHAGLFIVQCLRNWLQYRRK